MGQSLSDNDDSNSDSDDKSVIFDIPSQKRLWNQSIALALMLTKWRIWGLMMDLWSLVASQMTQPFMRPYMNPRGGNNSGNLPEIIIRLQKQLLKGYTLPPCPTLAPVKHTLSRAEILSLQHYLAWTESYGTVKAYSAHAQVLAEATKEVILSLYKARKLASKLTGIKASFVDMCPKSCMAFTGASDSQSTCSYSRSGKDCNEPCYQPNHGSSKAAPKPRATMLYMPIMPMIQAFYANVETSHEMRHRDHCFFFFFDSINVHLRVQNPM